MIKKLCLRSQVRESKDSHFASQDKLFNHINWETNFEGGKKYGLSLSMSYILKHLQLKRCCFFFFLKYIQIGFCVMKRKSKKCFHVYLGIEFPNLYLKMISGFFPAQTQEMQIEFISACTIRKGIWQKPLTLWWNVSCENYSLFKLK